MVSEMIAEMRVSLAMLSLSKATVVQEDVQGSRTVGWRPAWALVDEIVDQLVDPPPEAHLGGGGDAAGGRGRRRE